MPKLTCCQSLLEFLILFVFLPLLSPIIILGAPIYRILDAYTFEWFQSRNVCTPTEHRRKVTRVQAQVKAWSAAGRKSRMCTARAVSFSVHQASKRGLAQIQIDHLHHVAEINGAKRLVTVEPGLTMGQLTSILIPRGWTVPVVPEFESLTVGGVVCGGGLETSSTHFGLVAAAAVEFEVVLSSGEVVTCSKDENPDLFYAIPWSHGTLGFLVGVKFPLIPVKKYVQLEYHATESFAEAKALLESQDHFFVEGFAYARRKFVVMHGDLVDHVDSKLGSVNNINRWYKPFFYKHAESFLRRPRRHGSKAKAKIFIDYIPLRDYYHRHTRAYFWAGPAVLPFLNSAIFRYLFGWILPAANSKLGLRLVHFMQVGAPIFEFIGTLNRMVQDIVIPMKDLEAAIDFSHDTLGIYPLWLCPCKFFKKPGMVHSSLEPGSPETEMYVDFGIYGNVPKAKQPEFHSEMTTRQLEKFTIDHAGIQGLYADSFMTREEFWQMFDRTLYSEVRTKYEALDAFPDVYDKVSRTARRIQVNA